MPDANDVELILRINRGSEDAFKGLVEKNQRRPYWIAYNMLSDYDLAQDISQEAFVRVYKSLRQFDTKRNFYTWLYQIVVNLCIDHIRKYRSSKTSSIEQVGDITDADNTPDEVAQNVESKDEVKVALNKLPSKYKAVLTLRDIQGFSCDEIAEIVGCPSATVRWRIYKARKLFKEIWNNNVSNVGEIDD